MPAKFSKIRVRRRKERRRRGPEENMEGRRETLLLRERPPGPSIIRF